MSLLFDEAKETRVYSKVKKKITIIKSFCNITKTQLRNVNHTSSLRDH